MEVLPLLNDAQDFVSESANNDRQSGTQNAQRLTILVDDVDAVYPVRIDPTFRDVNWISLGGINGADFFIYAAAVDGVGNLYIGGSFTIAGDVIANNIAKWNGTSWSALGSGMSGVGSADVSVGGIWWRSICRRRFHYCRRRPRQAHC